MQHSSGGSGLGPAFPSPFSHASDPSHSSSGGGALKNQLQVEARRQLVQQGSGFLPNPFLANLRSQSPRPDGVRLDEAPPEYPKVQRKTHHARVKSWNYEEADEEDEEDNGPHNALLEVDLSRESFLAVVGHGRD